MISGQKKLDNIFLYKHIFTVLFVMKQHASKSKGGI
jgi:hypothetical protein